MIDRNEASAGQLVELHPGQQLRITLSENITTGYSWKLAAACASVLDLDHEETAPAASAALGAPRQRMWLFSATSPGHCDLRLEYARPWEKNATGKALTFPVRVAPRS